MRLHEITSQQYLDILCAGGDALALPDKAGRFEEDYYARKNVMDKRYRPASWERWASEKYYKHFYTVVE